MDVCNKNDIIYDSVNDAFELKTEAQLLDWTVIDLWVHNILNQTIDKYLRGKLPLLSKYGITKMSRQGSIQFSGS